MKLAEHLAGIAAAASAKELEGRAQEAWKEWGYGGKTGKRIRRAVGKRGDVLCAASPLFHLIPRLESRRHLVLCGDTYSVGYGRNSTGGRVLTQCRCRRVAG